MTLNQITKISIPKPLSSILAKVMIPGISTFLNAAKRCSVSRSVWYFIISFIVRTLSVHARSLPLTLLLMSLPMLR